jgi:hypothetical protein
MINFRGLKGFFSTCTGIIVLLLGYFVLFGPNYYNYTIGMLTDYETRVKDMYYNGAITKLITDNYNNMIKVETDLDKIFKIDYEKISLLTSRYHPYDRETDKLRIDIDNRISRMKAWYEPYCGLVVFLFGALYLSIRGRWESCKASRCL